MSNSTEQIKQITRKLFKHKPGSVQANILHPKRDWIIGLLIACCIVAGITVWNGYTYLANRDDGTVDTEIAVANPRYQADVVSQALDIFAAKEIVFEAISNRVVAIPEPEPELATTTATSTQQADTEPTLEQQTEVSQPETANQDARAPQLIQ